jgi:hypothetical protein
MIFQSPVEKLSQEASQVPSSNDKAEGLRWEFVTSELIGNSGPQAPPAESYLRQ